MKNLQDLFEHELRDIYYAENKLVDELQQTADQVTDEEIRRMFTDHARETEAQVSRLEDVFDALGLEAEGEKCEGLNGLLEEKEEFLEEDPPDRLAEYFSLTAAAKVERYEITAYESLVEMAVVLGHADVATLLEANLKEERETLEKLTRTREEYDVTTIMGEGSLKDTEATTPEGNVRRTTP